MLAYLNYILIWSCHVELEKEFFSRGGGVDGGYIKQSDLAKHAICTLLLKKKKSGTEETYCTRHKHVNPDTERG